jgi:hypothetical protein
MLVEAQEQEESARNVRESGELRISQREAEEQCLPECPDPEHFISDCPYLRIVEFATLVKELDTCHKASALPRARAEFSIRD